MHSTLSLGVEGMWQPVSWQDARELFPSQEGANSPAKPSDLYYSDVLETQTAEYSRISQGLHMLFCHVFNLLNTANSERL